MTKQQEGHHDNRESSGVITKEFFVGLLAIVLGGYNLLSEFGVIAWNVKIPQIIANVILVAAGFILWATAYRLWKIRWHSRRIF
ncbi:MAG: hypothetical protein V1866_04260 [archaeon]